MNEETEYQRLKHFRYFYFCQIITNNYLTTKAIHTEYKRQVIIFLCS